MLVSQAYRAFLLFKDYPSQSSSKLKEFLTQVGLIKHFESLQIEKVRCMRHFMEMFGGMASIVGKNKLEAQICKPLNEFIASHLWDSTKLIFLTSKAYT